MKLSRGVSWATQDGSWRKEKIEVDLDDYPEAADLDLDRKMLYVSVRVEQQLLLLQWLYGRVEAEAHANLNAQLDTLAERYLVPAEEPAA